MKIAFLSFFNGLSDRGGESFVHELASRLASEYQVSVYQNGKTQSNLPYAVKYLPSLQSLPEFDPVPDIIIPTNGRLQSILVKVWAATRKVKVVISGQSGIGWDDRLNLFTFPHRFVGLTDYQCAWAKTANPWVQVAKIPNGVDTEMFNPTVKPLPLNLPQPVVLYVAALEQIKRHHLLIEATSLTNYSLLLLGNGTLEDNIIQYAKAKLEPDRFKVMHLPHSQTPQIYTAADVFAYPTSPWESFGISMLEAMASGLPVVAGDDPIRREITGDAGVLADPTNPKQFAIGLDTALKTNWGKRPRIQAERFSWDVIAKQYSNLCKSL